MPSIRERMSSPNGKAAYKVNVPFAQDLCVCIEAQLRTCGTEGDGKIDWVDVCNRMKEESRGHAEATPGACRNVWKIMAYGMVDNSRSGDGDGDNADSDEEDAYLQPYRAVRRFNLKSDVVVFAPKVPPGQPSDASLTLTSPRRGVLSRILRGTDAAKKIKIVLCRDPKEPTIGIMRPLAVASHTTIYHPNSVALSRRKPAGLVFSASYINEHAGARRSSGSKHKKALDGDGDPRGSGEAAQATLNKAASGLGGPAKRGRPPSANPRKERKPSKKAREKEAAIESAVAKRVKGEPQAGLRQGEGGGAVFSLLAAEAAAQGPAQS